MRKKAGTIKRDAAQKDAHILDTGIEFRMFFISNQS